MEIKSNILHTKSENFKKLILYLHHKTAFTLAEVLITLGIIGVVAAMTIPNLMTAFAKHRVETQLVKFYSTMNQAIRMSVVDNEEPSCWTDSSKGEYTYEENVEFLETYFFPYMKISSYENCNLSYRAKHTGAVCMTNLDGTYWGFFISGNYAFDFFYYIDGDKTNNTPRNRFNFQVNGTVSDDNKIVDKVNYMEPFQQNWDRTTREDLKTHSGFGCNKDNANPAYCAKLIQLNSWKIPSDYPW